MFFFLLRALRQLTNEYLVGMVLMAGVTPLATAAGRAASELKAAVMQFVHKRSSWRTGDERVDGVPASPLIGDEWVDVDHVHALDIESDVSGSRVYEYEPELNTAIRFYHRRPRQVGPLDLVANYSYSESSTQPDPVVSTTVTDIWER